MEPRAYFYVPTEREWTIAEKEEFFASPDAIRYKPVDPRNPFAPAWIEITQYMTFEEARRRFPNTPIPGQEK